MIGLCERWNCQLHVGHKKFFPSILSHRGTCALHEYVRYWNIHPDTVCYIFIIWGTTLVVQVKPSVFLSFQFFYTLFWLMNCWNGIRQQFWRNSENILLKFAIQKLVCLIPLLNQRQRSSNFSSELSHYFGAQISSPRTSDTRINFKFSHYYRISDVNERLQQTCIIYPRANTWFPREGKIFV